MLNGYKGKILKMDLSSREHSVERLSEKRSKKFVGGTGLAISLLYENSQGYSPFSEKNPLIFITSPLVGTNTPGANQYTVVSKSPLTSLVGFGRSHGFFSPNLKFAGYDGIIITGKADYPVFLWIKDGNVEIKDARSVWGKNTYETEKLVKEKINDSSAKTLCIGPAGEEEVKFSCIMNDQGHTAGRCGMGAIMGSKNLKALAVKGSGDVPVANNERVSKLAEEWREISKEEHAAVIMSKYGNPGDYDVTEARNLSGDLPTKNFTKSQFEDWKKLSGEYIREKYKTRKTTCYNCHIAHDCIVEIEEGPNAGKYVGPEYETTAALGSNIDNSDTEALIRLGDLANRYGLDVIELSNTISPIMEAFEKDRLTKEDLDGIEVSWGNTKAVELLMEKIANREGIGDVLARGAKEAGDILGISDLIVHIKGMSPVLHDLRHHWGWLLSYTIGAAGPTHEGIAALDPASSPFSVEGMGTAAKNQQLVWWGHDLLGVCWNASTSVPMEKIFEFLRPVTGLDINLDEFNKAVERSITLARVFNIEQGLEPSDDWVSEKLLKAPIEGPAKGISAREKLGALVRSYYEEMGWDPKTGKPWKNTLEDLKLDNLVEDPWE